MTPFMKKYARFFVKTFSKDRELVWNISLGLCPRRYDPNDFETLLDESEEVSEMLFIS